MTPEQQKAVIDHRISRAKEAILDAGLAINNNRLNNALNRIYYAGFYMISALASKHDYSTSRHKQLLGWFNKNFVHNGKIKPELYKIISLAFDNRQESDYEDFTIFTLEEVKSYYDDMLIFLEEIEKVILN